MLYTSAPGSREPRWSSLDSGIDFETIGPLGGHCAVSAFGALGPPEGLNLFHEDAMVDFSKSKSTQKPFTLYFRFIFLSRRTINTYRLNVGLSLEFISRPVGHSESTKTFLVKFSIGNQAVSTLLKWVPAFGLRDWVRSSDILGTRGAAAAPWRRKQPTQAGLGI